MAIRSDPVNAISNVPWNAAAPGQVRTWQQYEDADTRQRLVEHSVISGGLHPTSASLVSAAFATEAFVPEHISQDATAITYPALADDVAWVIISSQNTAITGWTRVGTTAYYVKCQGSTSVVQPALPDHSAWLMGPVTITASAIVSIVDHRNRVLTSQESITESMTTSADAVWIFRHGGSITVASGKTFMMGVAPVIIGSVRQIFYGAGAVIPGPQEPFRPEWWGAVPNGTTDCTTALQAALTAANAVGAGIVTGQRVLLSKGDYRTTAPLNIYAKTTLQGHGRELSRIFVNHAGDGIRSTWPINSSTPVHINLRDFTLYTPTNASTGAGFVDLGGSFVTLTRVATGGFKYGIIFDQTELATIDDCDIEMTSSTSVAGLWLVNGPERVASVQTNFTNRITVTRTQLNSIGLGQGIQDDGGLNHTFSNNNFNGFLNSITVAGVYGLTVTGNEIETGVAGDMLVLWFQTFIGSTYVGPCRAFTVSGNYFFTGSSVVAVQIRVVSGWNGFIQGNTFVGNFSSAAVSIGASTANIAIGNNSRLFGIGQTSANFLAVDNSLATANTILAANQYAQRGLTYSEAGLASGLRVVTPRWAGATGTTEQIVTGDTVWCQNIDGTNGEYVVVSAHSATDWAATFLTSKAAGFLCVKGN